MGRRNTRREFLGTTLCGVGALATLKCDSADPALGRQCPDVLFIAIEDISPHRFGCHGNTIRKIPDGPGRREP